MGRLGLDVLGEYWPAMCNTQTHKSKDEDGGWGTRTGMRTGTGTVTGTVTRASYIVQELTLGTVCILSS